MSKPVPAPDSGQAPGGQDLKRLATSIFMALGLFACLYGVLTAIHRHFRYLQSGADLVVRMKHDLSHEGQPFRDPRALKVMAFGHSQILSGFIPSLFDAEMARAGVPSVESYNFGMPGSSRFVSDLEAMVARGVKPDVILLILAWPGTEFQPTAFQPFANEKDMIDNAFPFRKMPRDLLIAVAEAHGHPGLVARNYRDARRIIEGVKRDRGYYFIARQSHYPNHELPDSFTAPSDTPGKPYVRTVPLGPVFKRLEALCEKHGIQCLLIPTYYRKGQYAPPPERNEETVRTLAGHPRFHVVGPDYLLFPNKLFSDSIHTNPRGAEIYTRAIAGLVSGWMSQHPNEAR